MTAKIYRPARTATQSGSAKTDRWLLEFEAEEPRGADPLMGWTSSADMKSQIKLWFDTADEAVAYATRNGLAYRVYQPQDETPKTLSYSDNFKVSRLGQWTH